MDKAPTVDLAVELLKRHEGLSLKPYTCPSGKLTIGYGRNLEDYGITEKEARFLLLNNVMECIGDLHRVFPGFNKFTVGRQAALIDMVYNLGINRFMGFEKTIALIKAREWELAGDEMLRSQWAKQVKGRAAELAVLIKEG